MQKWQCRWSSTLGELEASHQEVWGTEEYNNLEDPTVFVGIYGLPDLMAFRKHKGEKCIFWCGSDIRHFKNGYWLDEVGKYRIDPINLSGWLNEYPNYVENQVEYQALKELGIESIIIPSFLGDVNKFTVQKLWTDKERYYSSVSGNDFKLYGWDKIVEIAHQNPDIEYHLYGNTEPYSAPPNCIIHGRVPKEQMNEEVKHMTGAIRMVEFEGFSEIIAKSILWGQEPISLIKYKFLESNNPRKELLRILNSYPWNIHKIKI